MCDPMDWRIVRVWANLTVTAPMVTLKHYAEVSSFVWRIRGGASLHLLNLSLDEEHVTRIPLPHPYRTVSVKFPVVSVADLEPFGPRWSGRLMAWTTSLDFQWLFWRAGIWTCVILVALMAALARTRRWSYALVLAPAFLNSAVLAILANVPEFRHVYPMVIMSQLLFLFFVLMAFGPRGMIKVPPGNGDE